MTIYYVNSKGITIYLDREPYYMTENTEIFDYEWLYDTNHSKVDNLHKDITQKAIQVAIVGTDKEDCYTKRDKLYDAIDVDCVNTTPGTLHFGDYYIKCYLVSNVKDSKYIGNAKSIINLQLVKESTAWLRTTMHEFTYSNSADTSGRGYPYGYEYDYSAGAGSTGMLNNEHFGACDFIMKIKGYALNPYITIADHVYKVNGTIQENEVLTINSKEKTIILTKNDIQENYYSKRDRDNYIFEKIPAGESKVYWNSKFDFEITLLEERSEPKWT